jgi:hypothetical protein
MLFQLLTTFALASSAMAQIPAVPFFGGHWVNTWVSMPQLTEFANLPPPPFVRWRQISMFR